MYFMCFKKLFALLLFLYVYFLDDRVFGMGGSMSNPYELVGTSIKPKIVLFTRYNTSNGMSWSLISRRPELTEFKQAIQRDSFSYVTVHGFVTGQENEWARDLKDTILDSHNANVFIVDWSEDNKLVQASVSESLVTAMYVAQLLANFFRRLDLDSSEYQNMHFIGHSIGASIANDAIEKIHHKVGHLTALDPFNKERVLLYDSKFFNHNTSKFFSSTKLQAADFSTVIHSDAHKLGVAYDCGHIDIYLNGGVSQPGCDTNEQYLDSYSKTNCNHEFATKFFKSIGLHELSRADNLSEELQNQIFDSELDKCFPVAYLTNNFESFKSGRHGHCSRRENLNIRSGCVHAGLPGPMVNYEFRPQTSLFDSMYTLLTDSKGGCVYTYRLIVGVKRKHINEERANGFENRIFVRVALSDRPNHSKTIELSNNSTNYFKYNLNFRNQLVTARGIITMTREAQIQNPLDLIKLDYQSILITFNSEVTQAMNPFNNELAHPLHELHYVDVWGLNIDQVLFVVLDYMSHPDFEVRKTRSFLMMQADSQQKNYDYPFFDCFATFSAKKV